MHGHLEMRRQAQAWSTCFYQLETLVYVYTLPKPPPSETSFELLAFSISSDLLFVLNASINMGKLFNISLAIFAATGSFMFGYDSGVMTDVIQSPNFLAFFNTVDTSPIIGAINSVSDPLSHPATPPSLTFL